MPLLTLPLALMALTALPALAAIYWLRNRYRRQVVSSLLLYMDQREAREGGVRVQKVQTPLLLLIELAVLALLALAAAGPYLPRSNEAHVMVVVLDDAYAMQAVDRAGRSVREKAVAAIQAQLEGQRFAARFIVAGQQPQVLGEPAQRWDEAEQLLERWTCTAPRASLRSAIGVAREVGGAEATIVVVTHRAPEHPLEAESNLWWWAFGSSQPNVAFTAAVRTAASDGSDRLMLEVAHLADAPASTVLTVEGQTQRLELAAGRTRRLWFDLPPGTGPVRASLPDDALTVDNQVVLLPARAREVGVALQLNDQTMRDVWERALAASGLARLDGGPADLVVTDGAVRPEAGPRPAQWVVQVDGGGEAAAFTGPFVIDRSHRLTSGLSLAGVVWGAGRGVTLPGVPLITAGDETLMSHRVRGDGSHLLRMRWQPAVSTLQQTPAFPALVWNLLAWRASHLPGAVEPNVRLGATAEVALPSTVRSAIVVTPSGDRQELMASEQVVRWQPTGPGVWQLGAADQWHAVAVNVLDGETSDLRPAEAGRWGEAVGAQTLERQYRSMAWALLLVVLALLTCHGYLTWRSGGGQT